MHCSKSSLCTRKGARLPIKLASAAAAGSGGGSGVMCVCNPNHLCR